MHVKHVGWIAGATGLFAWPAHAQQIEIAFSTGAQAVPVAGWIGVAVAAMLGVLAHRKLRGQARTLSVMVAIACGAGALAWQGAEMKSAYAAEPPVSVSLQSSPTVVAIVPTNLFYELRNVLDKKILILSIKLVNAPGYAIVPTSLGCSTPQPLAPDDYCNVRIALAPT